MKEAFTNMKKRQVYETYNENVDILNIARFQI